jgi:DNA-binding NarL/FixJ family response regulator
MMTMYPQTFSERELQVIPLLLEGKSTRTIASELSVSTRAVEIHLTHIYEKLGVCSRAEAIIKLMHLYKK